MRRVTVFSAVGSLLDGGTVVAPGRKSGSDWLQHLDGSHIIFVLDVSLDPLSSQR